MLPKKGFQPGELLYYAGGPSGYSLPYTLWDQAKIGESTLGGAAYPLVGSFVYGKAFLVAPSLCCEARAELAQGHHLVCGGCGDLLPASAPLFFPSGTLTRELLLEALETLLGSHHGLDPLTATVEASRMAGELEEWRRDGVKTMRGGDGPHSDLVLKYKIEVKHNQMLKQKLEKQLDKALTSS